MADFDSEDKTSQEPVPSLLFSLLTLPLLLFLGLPAAVANGTNRVAILFQNIFAIGGFKRQGIFPARLALLGTLPALAGPLAAQATLTTISEGRVAAISADGAFVCGTSNSGGAFVWHPVGGVTLVVSAATGAQLKELLRKLPDGMTFELSLDKEEG